MLQRGSTALHMACRRHHVEIALVLLHHGCQFDVVDHVSYNQRVVMVTEMQMTRLQVISKIRPRENKGFGKS